MAKLVVAEKPSVGRDIARVLGAKEKGEGFLRGGEWVVTWAIGHLVALCEPDEMDERYKRWSMDTLAWPTSRTTSMAAGSSSS